MTSILAFITGFLVLLSAEAANREGAQLIVHKVFDKIPVVVDQPVNVTVTIYNVGTGDATDVALVDGVSGDSFEVADDMSLTADFDVIAPGESAKHFYTVTPKSCVLVGALRRVRQGRSDARCFPNPVRARIPRPTVHIQPRTDHLLGRCRLQHFRAVLPLLRPE